MLHPADKKTPLLSSPRLAQNLIQVLRWRALHEPDNRAYQFLGQQGQVAESLSYAELAQKAAALGARLASQGRAGSRVLLLFQPGLDFLVAFYACLWARRVAVPLPFSGSARRDERIEHVRQDCAASLALTHDSLLPALQASLGGMDIAAVSGAGLPLAGRLVQPEQIKAKSLAFLQYSSGSTGKPKGVKVSHGNIMANARSVAEAFGTQPSSRMLSWLPLFHDLGLLMGSLQSMVQGFDCQLMAPNAFLQEPLLWLRALSLQRSSISAAPNFAFDLCVRALRQDPSQAQGLDLTALETLVTGAEPIRPETIEAFQKCFAPFGLRPTVFTPGYGLAEATLVVSGGPARRGARIIDAGGPSRLVACGRLASELELSIVDPHSLAPCAPGSLGEIWVRGPMVAQGYWGQAGLTRQTFKARAKGESQGTWLRTGDLGFMSGGELVISGRLKDLIIIRGSNFFPQDLERCVEAACPDLKPGASAALGIEGPEGEGLLLLAEARRHPQASHDEIFACMQKALAEQHGLLPLHLGLLKPGGSLKTSSGKIRRREMRQAWLEGRSPLLAQWQPPAPAQALGLGNSQVEACLGRPEAGLKPELSLLAQGFDSLALAALQARARMQQGIDLSAPDLFELSWGQVRERLLQAGSRRQATEAQPRALQAPLLPLQQSYYFSRQAGQASGATVAVIELKPELAAEGLGQAWRSLAKRHGALRSRVEEEGGKVMTRELAQLEAGLEILDWRAGAAEEAVRLAKQREEALALETFQSGPAYRAELWLMPGGQRQLALAFDHLLLDGYSLGLALQELAAEPGSPASSSSFASLAASRQPDFTKREHDKAFWLSALEDWGGFPEAPLQAGLGQGHGVLYSGISPSLLGRLEAAAAQQGVTLFALLCAAFARLWAFAVRQDRLIFNTPLLGRDLSQASEAAALGCFADILPLDLKGCATASWTELLKQAQAALLQAGSHSAVSAVELARWRAGQSKAAPAAISPVTITHALFLDAGACALGPLRTLRSSAPETWLDLLIFRDSGGLRMSWNFDQSKLAPAWVGQLAQGLQPMLESCLEHDPSLGFDRLLPARDQALQRAYDPLELPDFGFKPLHQAFDDVALAQPEHLAIGGLGQGLSYGELKLASEQWAQTLLALGAQPNDCVAIHLERGPWVAVAILAILRAGCRYVPLDPVYPEDRIHFMVEDSGCRWAFTQAGLCEKFSHACAPLRMDLKWEKPAQELAWPDVGPRQGAYVIYTSGSTGKPKGVQVRHAEVFRLIAATRDFYHFNSSDVWPWFHSYSFDVSVWEFWACLLHGGRLFCVGQDEVRSPEAYQARLRAEGATVLNQTPSAFYALIRADLELPPGQRLSQLRWAIFAGEALSFEALKPWIAAHGDEQPRLVNMYGITETTVHSTLRRVTRQDVEAGRGSLIGRPIPDLAMRLLDDWGRPVPVGSVGEIYVGGAGVAEGYLARPELTAARFSVEGQRAWYRSGDLARFLPDGELEYLGRNDFQLKIRGFRVELGEIEEKLRRYPALSWAAVLAHDKAGDKRLVAYVKFHPGQACAPEALREHLRSLLPDYMIPLAFVALDEVPLTENGKLDRRRLPAPEAVPGSGKQSQPKAGREAEMLAIWRELLEQPGLGVEDDFFACGGHSLLAAELAALLRQRLGLALATAQIFEHPTVRRLAAQMPESGAGEASMPPGPWPLAPGQRAIWMAQQLQSSGSYNVVSCQLFDAKQAPDFAALGKAWQMLVQRHAALRTRLIDTPEGPLQSDDAPAEPLLSENCPEGLESRLRLEASREFDLAQGPLLRAGYLDCPEGKALLICAHHLVMDQASLDLLWQEWALALQDPALLAAGAGHPARLGLWHQSKLHEQARWLEAWRELLQPALPLAPRSSAEPLGKATAARLEAHLSESVAAAYEAFTRALSLTPFAAWSSAWAAFLASQDPRGQALCAFPVEERPEASMAGSVGAFVNTLPLAARCSPSELQHPELVLGSLGARVQRSLAWRHAGLELLLEKIPGLRCGGRVLDGFFVYQAPSQAPAPMAACQGRWIEAPANEARAPWTLLFQRQPGQGARLHLEYDTSYSATQASQLLAAWIGQVASWAGQPSLHLPETEAPSKAGEEEGCLERIGRFARDGYPYPALDGAEGSQSYAWLWGQALNVAGHLQAHGIKPGDRVGLWAEPSHDWAACLLGILASGAVYVPLDPQFPEPRLRDMAAQAGLKACLSGQGAEDSLGDCPHWGLRLALGHAAGQLYQHGPEDPAYVIFTSGSSGRPKGVLGPWRALEQLATRLGQAMGLAAGSRILRSVSVSFDASLEELFPAWRSGACLVLDGPAQRSIEDLLETVASQQVTHLHLPAAYWHEWMGSQDQGPEPRLASVRLLVTGGEAPRRQALQRWAELTQEKASYINAYGPTEAGVTCACWSWQPGQALPEKLPTGQALPGVSLALVRADGQAAMQGEEGELWIGGPGLALCYIGPDSQQRFVSRDLGQGMQAWYRSGDLASWGKHGLQVLGRVDEQVKVSGWRVEPAEIEQSLCEHPAVRQAAVCAEQAGDGLRLVAHVVLAQGQDVDEAGLRQWACQRLPQALCPASFRFRPSLPLNAHGKVDRKALSSMAAGPSLHELIQLWREVLGLKRADAQTHFFEQGGNSLRAIRLCAEIKKRWNHSIKPGLLYESPSPMAVLTQLLAGAPKQPLGALTRLNAVEQGQPLLLLHALTGSVEPYRAWARSLSQPVWGLEGSLELARQGWQAMLEHGAALAEPLAQAAGLELAGWSMGGLLAASLATHPKLRGRVSRLSLVDSSAPQALHAAWARHDPNFLKKAFERELGGHPGPGFEEALALFSAHFWAMQDWKAQMLDLPMRLFTSYESAAQGQVAGLWAGLALRSIQIQMLPGSHHELLQGACLQGILGKAPALALEPA